MARTIYVKGNILVKTEDYKYNTGDGCLFPIPEGADVIIPSTIVDGSPCLIIDNNFPYSIFNTYRATGGFSSMVNTSYYYNSDANEVYHNYQERKAEILNMLDNLEHIQLENRSFLYKLMMGNAITILDSFVRDIIVSKITSSEEFFNSYYSTFYRDLNEVRKAKFDQMDRGTQERSIIKELYEDNYSSAKKINGIIISVFGCPNVVCSGTNIGNYIKERHEIYHKNSRKKDGSYKKYNSNDVKKAIIEDEKVINNIMNLV